MTTRNPRATKRRPPRLELAAILLVAGHGCCAAQDGARSVNSIPTGQGFGAANAGATGRLPRGPASAAPQPRVREPGRLDSYDRGLGFGAANAGATGKLPRAPSAPSGATARAMRRGDGPDAGPGGAATGAAAGASFGNVGTSGTDGAGSR